MCYTFDCLKPPRFYHWQPASGMSDIYHLELSTHPPAPTRVRTKKKKKKKTTDHRVFFLSNSHIDRSVWKVFFFSFYFINFFISLHQQRLKQICFKVAGKAVELPAWAVLHEREFPAVVDARRPCQLFVYIERCSRQYECAWGRGSYSSLPMNHCHKDCQLNRGTWRKA